MDQVIYESSSTLVHRGHWNSKDVVFKKLKTSARTPTSIARYQREFDLNQSLTSPHICQAIAFDDQEMQIVFEDDHGESLREFVSKHNLTFNEQLDIATELAKALQSIHDEDVIHRDLNPANILIITDEVDGGAYTVKLIDFGLATLTSKAYPSQETISLTGTLPYISPEQTGRVNRIIDYRTDLYSLGVTLYELFAGHPPFQQQDPLELIHAHIAANPPALDQVMPSAPAWLVQMLDKLLAKQPEKRYQSAASVYDDLVNAAHYANVVPFRLGRTDRVEQIVTPKKLYGRRGSQQQLIDLLERCKQGETLFVCISGGQGMGKTALCDEVKRQSRPLNFLSARVNCQSLELIDTDTLWIELLKPMLRQLLSLPETQAEATLARLRKSRSPHMTSLADHIPELAGLMETPAAEPGLPGKGISELLKHLSPIALLPIIENTEVLPPECLSRLLEVSVEHRNILALFTWENYDPTSFSEPRIATKTTSIELHLLDKADIRDLLSDMLSLSEARVRELASEVFDKTDGVPALVHVLVQELHSAGSIHYDRQTNSWNWNLEEIRRYYFNSNSVARISSLLDELPQSAREPLCAGACLGGSFELHLVAQITDAEQQQITKQLRPAISNGLITLLGDGRYQFSHLRVRSTLYQRIPEKDKQRLHWAAAQAMRKQTQPGPRSIDIAHHLNAATHLVDADQQTRTQVAHQNLLAAKEALTDGNFRGAYKFSRMGLVLVDRIDETLFAALIESAAFAAFLCGDFQQLEHILEQGRVAGTSTSTLLETRIRAAMVQNNLQSVATLARGGLDALSTPLSKPRGLRLRSILAIVAQRLHFNRWATDVDPLPHPLNSIVDPQYKQAAKLVGYMTHVNFHLGHPTLSKQISNLITHAPRHGFSGEVAFAYACAASTAIIQCMPGQAKALANHAREIADQYPTDAFSVRALIMVNGMVDPWFGNFDQTVRNLVESVPRAMALHDFEFAAAAGSFYAVNGFLRGIELGSLKRTALEHVEHINRPGHLYGLNLQNFVLQMVSTLLGQPLEESPVHEQARTIENQKDQVTQACVYTLRLYYAVLFNDYNGALSVATLAHEHQTATRATPLYMLYIMCRHLVLARNSTRKSGELKRGIRELQHFVNLGTSFAEPKLHILRAEAAYQNDKFNLALEHWERAADCARKNGIANDEALAYELAARACDQRGRLDFAKMFARNSYQAYLRWGAVAKANQLERELPGLIDEDPSTHRSHAVTVTDLTDLTVRDFQTQQNSVESTEYSDRVLDTSTVLRAAQTISGEIVLDRVLTKLLRLALEHAGAQKACMILRTEDRLYVEAVAGVDGGATRRLSP
ncbi:MAG: protein kinase, partial [Gammaproteobacteria bacterium]|nr:protein kinase [Gammaproteobacteria bacterium]